MFSQKQPRSEHGSGLKELHDTIFGKVVIEITAVILSKHRALRAANCVPFSMLRMDANGGWILMKKTRCSSTSRNRFFLARSKGDNFHLQLLEPRTSPSFPGFPHFRRNTWNRGINGRSPGSSRWRYVSTIFLTIFWGYIPLHSPKK